MPAAYLAPQSAIGGIGPGLRDAVAGFRDVTGADEERQKAAYLPKQLKDQAETQQIKMNQIRAEEKERVEKETIGNQVHSLSDVLGAHGLPKDAVDWFQKRAIADGVAQKMPSGDVGIKTKHYQQWMQGVHQDVKGSKELEEIMLKNTMDEIEQLKQASQDPKSKLDPKETQEKMSALLQKKQEYNDKVTQLDAAGQRNAQATKEAIIQMAGGEDKVQAFLSDPANKKIAGLYAGDQKTGGLEVVKALHEQIKEEAKVPKVETPHTIEKISPDGKTAQKYQYNPKSTAEDKYDIPIGSKYPVKGQVINVNAGIKEKSKQANFADYFEALKDKNPDVTYDEAFKQYSKDKKAGGKAEKEKPVITALKSKKDLKNDDLVKAVKGGSLTREEALAIAKEKGLVQ
jgi:hypothetical protein